MKVALAETELFAGVDEGELVALLQGVGAISRHYPAGARILGEGETVSSFGLLLSGQAQAVKGDAQGRSVILALLKPGDAIGILLAARLGRPSPVTVRVTERAEVLHLPFEGLIAGCQRGCPGADRLLRNYVGIAAEKGLLLHERIDCLLRPTVREKVLAYLHRETERAGRSAVTLPLDRAAMADYLHVERSALSRELSRMRRDGLIDFCKNRFELLEAEERDDPLSYI